MVARFSHLLANHVQGQAQMPVHHLDNKNRALGRQAETLNELSMCWGQGHHIVEWGGVLQVPPDFRSGTAFGRPERTSSDSEGI